MNKLVVLRPGALGDVLAVRGVLAFLKAVRPDAETALSAPGAKGRFLARPGWADRFFDWERKETAWLFSDGEGEPPETLAPFFAEASLVLAYVGTESGADTGIQRRLGRLAPDAEIVLHPARPPEGNGEAVSAWLMRAAFPFAEKRLSGEKARALAALASSRKIIMPPAEGISGTEGRYAVIHPGSGSGKKNWRLENFTRVGKWLLRAGRLDGRPFFQNLFIVSGEADGDLGARLGRSIPGARHCHCLELETLASLLGGAFLYVGNDSGVSHLAGAVAGPAGRPPRLAVVFGPSDSRAWAPAGAVVLEAGPELNRLSAVAACGRIGESLGFSC